MRGRGPSQVRAGSGQHQKEAPPESDFKLINALPGVNPETPGYNDHVIGQFGLDGQLLAAARVLERQGVGVERVAGHRLERQGSLAPAAAHRLTSPRRRHP